MLAADRALSKYQRKMSTVEMLAWEHSVERRRDVLEQFSAPTLHKSTKPNMDLIDLDLIIGSTFAKVKPQQRLWSVVRQGVLKAVLFPLYRTWWRRHLGSTLYRLLCLIYFAYTYALGASLVSENRALDMPNVGICELITPGVVALSLSVLKCQIVAFREHYPLSRAAGFASSSAPLSSGRPSTGPAPGKSQNIGLDSSAVLQQSGQTSTSLTSMGSEVTSDSGGSDHPSSNVSWLQRAGSAPVCLNETASGVPPHGDRHRSLSLSTSRNSGRVPQSARVRRSDSGFAAMSSSPAPTRAHNTGSGIHSTTPGTRQRVTASRHRRTWERRRSRVSAKLARLSANRGALYNTDSSESKSDEASTSSPLSHQFSHLKRQTCSEPSYFSNVKSCLRTNDDIPPCYAKTSGTDSEASCASGGSVTSCRPDVLPSSPWDNPLLTFTAVTDHTGCAVWERGEVKKVYLSALDICSVVVDRVGIQKASTGYFVFGSLMAVSVSLLPAVYRALSSPQLPMPPSLQSFSVESITGLLLQVGCWICTMLQVSLGSSVRERVISLICLISSLMMSALLFFLLSVVERSFKQRLLLAKYFCYLTSARKARKFDLVHFRLKNVRNIKTWLSVRSCLKKTGPQRSVNMIASVTSLFTVLLVTFLCVELLDNTDSSRNHSYRTHLLLWCFALGVFVVRIMTLGSHVNNKYRNMSVVLTEQINLHLQMEKKPHKKEALGLANNVLKLAVDLLKNLERPYTILGFSANPFLYNVTRLLVLSACSGVLSDMFGFKLKLNNLKLM